MAVNYLDLAVQKVKSVASSLGKFVTKASENPFLNPGGYVGTKMSEWSFPEQKKIVSQLSTPEGQSRFNQEPSNDFRTSVRQYIGNRYIAPMAQVPYNVGQLFGKDKTPLERGSGALGVAGGTIAMAPDPIGDIVMPAYDYLKGVTAAQKQGQGTLQSYKTGIKSLTGQQYTGLGTATGQTGVAEGALNIAELPLILFAGGKITRGKQMDAIVKRAAPEIENTFRAIKQYNTFAPVDQMTLISQTRELAKRFIPQVVNSKEMRKLETSNVRQWLDTMGTFLQDRLAIAVNPELNVGLNTRAIKRMDTQPKGVGGEGINPLMAEAKKYGSAEEFVKARVPEMKTNKTDLVAKNRGDTIEVDDLFVDKKGTGLGSKIVKELENYADANGKFLQINKAYNKSFWGKFGFEEIDSNTLRRDPKSLTSLSPEGGMGVKSQTQIKGKPQVQIPPKENIQAPLPETPQVKTDVSLPNDNTKIPVGSTSQYNAGKINTKNQKVLKQAIDEVKPSFEKLVGEGPMTHKEILAQSTEFSDDVIKAVGRKTTEDLGAAQLRLRQNIADMADKGTVTPELLEAMRADASFARSTAQLQGQRNIPADPKTALGKNMIKYVKAVNDVADDIDLVMEKAKGVDFNDVEQAGNFYRQFVKPSLGSWLDRVRYSSMLSSPNTFINNASSNLQGTAILAPLEKIVEGGLDAIVSGFTGAQRKHFAGEGVKYMQGYFSNLKPALKNFTDAMKGGSDAAEMFNIPLTKKGTVGRKVENSLAFFPRLQQATDELFNTLTTGGLEKANAYRTAKGGVKQTAEQIASESKRRLFNQPFGSDQSHLLNAIEYIPSKIMEATHSKNPFIKWTAKFTFPFVRIPTNVFKAGIEYSPLGLGTLPGAVNKTEQASKALMGTAVALGAWTLASADRLTFGMPTSEKQRDAFTAAGMQPYSVKIGDKWIGYTKFHPIIGFNMALASAVREQMDKQTISDDEMDTVIGVAGKWLTYFANQSYVKQMGDFMSLAKGNETAVGQTLSNYPTQLIPFRAFFGWLARAFDPNERKIDPDGSKLDKSLQSIMMSIPGLRNTLPARTDSLGQPVPQQNRFLNLVSPGKVTQEVPVQKSQFDQMKAKSIQSGKDKAIKDQIKKSMGGTSALDGGRIAYWDAESASTKELNVGEVSIMPDSNPYEKALKEKKAYAMAEKVLNLKPEEQAAVFYSLGISPDDANYFTYANQDDRIKSLYVDEEMGKLDTSNRANLVNYLISQRKEVNAKTVLTSTKITELNDAGIISDAEAKMLKNLKIVNGKPVTKLTGRGKKTALKKISYTPAKLNIKAPNMKTLLAKTVKLKSKKYKFRRTL